MFIIIGKMWFFKDQKDFNRLDIRRSIFALEKEA